MKGAPFTDHPFVVAIPAARATWDAERTRLAGASDPAAWRAAAKSWEDLGWPHRAGYAWWRHAEAQLAAGQPPAMAAAALRSAATAADGHQPLLAQVRTLADRARIKLQPPVATHRKAPPHAGMPTPYGLTGRELAVLRLVAAGRSNAPDRHRTVHQPRDRRRPCHQHLAQARRVQPGAGRRLGRTRRASGQPAALNPSQGESKPPPT
jgi:hypothetical protein